MKPHSVFGFVTIALACTSGNGTGTDTSMAVQTDVDTDVSTDTVDDTASPTGDTAPPVSEFFTFFIEGNSADCILVWDVAYLESDHPCPKCVVTIDRQFDVIYTLSDRTDTTGCPSTPLGELDAFVLEITKGVGAFDYTPVLQNSYPVWVFASAYNDVEQVFVLGSRLLGKKPPELQTIALFGAELNEITGEFRFWNSRTTFQGSGVLPPRP